MSLIIGVVGLICYVIYFVYASEKEKACMKSIEDEIKHSHMALAIWLSKVTDKELEKKANYRQNREEILKVLKTFNSFDNIEKEFSSLVYFEGDILDYICFRKNYGAYSGNKLLQRIYMGLSGKLLYKDSWYGIDAPDPDTGMWELHLELMQWLDSQIKLHGVNENMLFKPGAIREIWSLERIKKEKMVNDDITPEVGVFYWYPIKNFNPPGFSEYLNK